MAPPPEEDVDVVAGSASPDGAGGAAAKDVNVADERISTSPRPETGPQRRRNSTPRITIPDATATDVVGPGPSTDLATPMFASHPSLVTTGPSIIINLLLASTGTRHPYKIDEKYLVKRGVKAKGTGDSFDPFVISVYTLKELIWQDWRPGERSCRGLYQTC
jgi:hypothetical protein